MFERQILSQLREWKNKDRRKPLVLRGARQVGKTTVINMFGREFDNYLQFNLDDRSDVSLFERDLPFDGLVDSLYAIRGRRKVDGTTLIFIDEIQNSPKTISLLRYFKEKRPDLHVVAAGSLLENLADFNASFPAGWSIWR